MIARRKTRTVRIGRVRIGNNFPIAVQAMAKAHTKDIANVVKEAGFLVDRGAEILRVAVKDIEDARAIKQIKKKIRIPIVADIHFDYRLALVSIESGVDKIRLNPGNLNKIEELRIVCAAVKKARIPVRVGVNSGSVSLNRSELAKKDNLSAIMVKSALKYAGRLEDLGVKDIVISLKAEDVLTTIEAYRSIAKRCDYPLHLGVTATGGLLSGLVKSSLGIGILLNEGLGDTIRVSLTSDSVSEVVAAKNLLQSLKLRNFGPEIISCPTCGRCQVDLVKIVQELEQRMAGLKIHRLRQPLKIAVMGCEVNGPGEAKLADLGVAFGKKDAIFFDKGVIKTKISRDNIIGFLINELGRRYA